MNGMRASPPRLRKSSFWVLEYSVNGVPNDANADVPFFGPREFGHGHQDIRVGEHIHGLLEPRDGLKLLLVKGVHLVVELLESVPDGLPGP